MHHHEQQKCNAFFVHVFTAQLCALIHATMHAAIPDACMLARLTIAVTTESTWNDINRKFFVCMHWCSTLFPIFFHCLTI